MPATSIPISAIRSIQIVQVELDDADDATVAAITAVTMAKTVITPLGTIDANGSYLPSISCVIHRLTSATQITVYRVSFNATALYVEMAVVEYN